MLSSGQLLGEAAAGDGRGRELGLHHGQGGGRGAAPQVRQLGRQAEHLLLECDGVGLYQLIANRLRVKI